MNTITLREKWMQSIINVDERFLLMIDRLYEEYTTNKKDIDFFDELPIEIQEILLESRKGIKQGIFFSHEEVIAASKKKYNII